jgi:hypothetical protein
MIKRSSKRTKTAKLQRNAANFVALTALRNVSTILRQPSVEFKLGCLAFSAVD